MSSRKSSLAAAREESPLKPQTDRRHRQAVLTAKETILKEGDYFVLLRQPGLR